MTRPISGLESNCRHTLSPELEYITSMIIQLVDQWRTGRRIMPSSYHSPFHWKTTAPGSGLSLFLALRSKIAHSTYLPLLRPLCPLRPR